MRIKHQGQIQSIQKRLQTLTARLAILKRTTVSHLPKIIIHIAVIQNTMQFIRRLLAMTVGKI